MEKAKPAAVTLRPASPAPDSTDWRSLFDRWIGKVAGKPQPLAAAPVFAQAAQAEPLEPLYQRAFVTEAEARQFAESVVAQGYRAEVEHNAYDYTWEVEVFAAAP